MITKKLLALIVSSYTLFAAPPTYIFHNNDYALHLLEHGVNSFLNQIPDSTTYVAALHDIIKHSLKNKTDITQLFHQLNNELDSRINRIERLKNKTIDTQAIYFGIGCMGTGLALSLLIYYYYTHHYRPIKQEFLSIKQSFEKQNIQISVGYKNIRLIIPNNRTFYDSFAANRMCRLNDIIDDRAIGLIVGAVFPFMSCMYGLAGLFTGIFNAHFDDKNLEKYIACKEATQQLLTQ